MDISQYLQRLKEDTNMSWSDLAKKAGIPVSTVRDIVNGVTKYPAYDAVARIVSALGGSLDKAYEMPPKIQEQIAVIREAEEIGPEEFKATISTMRNVRIEMLQHQRESYERELATRQQENERLHQENRDLRKTLKIILIAAFAIMFSIIGMLIYDLTHLDRGWIQSFYGIETATYQPGHILQSAMDFLRGLFA